MTNIASENHSLLLLALAVLLLPFLSFLILALLGRRLPGRGDWLSTAFTGLSFLAALPLFAAFFTGNTIPAGSAALSENAALSGNALPAGGISPELLSWHIDWVTIGSTRFEASLYLEPLTVLMLLVVTFISLLVHVYSMFYMKGDPRYHRYWTYLSLFVFSMLGLVLSGNLLITYMCWELVGLASYLMIGFWMERPAAALASQKSFIMNRVGDIGFLIALMSLFSLFGTFDIAALNREAALQLGSGTAPGLRICLAAGGLALAAFAKSAQFPLHTWLPDAMEGPTSVSALIHAATMVAAGVFLLTRMFSVFPEVFLTIIAVAGVFTAFLAASAAAAQYDIKKVLAYSTISQLGFMMLGIGTGHFQAAMFHLVTHAFFKCLLFLGAGAVIHHIHDIKHHHRLEIGEQDMRIMGGLRKEMPLTFWTYTLAAAALVGLPFFSGFLSKEMILAGSFSWALETGGAGILLPFIAVCTSLLTAWYIGRQWSLVFLGRSRTREFQHIREGNFKMKLPMVVLGAFTIFIWFSLNPLGTSDIPLVEALAPGTGLHGHLPGPLAWGLLLLSAVLVPLTVWAASRKYAGREAFPESGASRESGQLRSFLANGWYLDTVYNTIFVRPVLGLGNLARALDGKLVDGLVNFSGRLGIALARLVAWWDRYVVDGLVNFIGARARSLGDFFRGFQTGRVQQYMALAVFSLMVLYLIKLLMDQ